MSIQEDQIKNLSEIQKFKGLLKGTECLLGQNFISSSTGVITETMKVTIAQICRQVLNLAEIFDKTILSDDLIMDAINGITLSGKVVELIEDDIAEIESGKDEINNLILQLRGIVEPKITGEDLLQAIDTFGSNEAGIEVYYNSDNGMIVLSNRGYQAVQMQIETLQALITQIGELLEQQIEQIEQNNNTLIALKNSTYFLHRYQYLRKLPNFIFPDCRFVCFEVSPSMFFLRQKAPQFSTSNTMRYIQSVSSKDTTVMQYEYGLSFNGMGMSRVTLPEIIDTTLITNPESLTNISVGNISVPPQSRYYLAMNDMMMNPLFTTDLPQFAEINILLGFKGSDLLKFLNVINGNSLVFYIGNEGASLQSLNTSGKLSNTIIRLFLTTSGIKLIISTSTQIFETQQILQFNTIKPNDLIGLSFGISMDLIGNTCTVRLNSFIGSTDNIVSQLVSIPFNVFFNMIDDFKELLKDSRVRFNLCGGNLDIIETDVNHMKFSHFIFWDEKFDNDETKEFFHIIFGI